MLAPSAVRLDRRRVLEDSAPREGLVSALRILGIVLVVLGLGAFATGVVGLLSDEDATAAPEPGPTATTGSSSSPSETPSETPVDQPNSSPSETPGEEPTAETPEAFFTALGDAFATGDATFLFSRVHPFVFERYGRSQCRRSLASLDVPGYEVEVLAVEEGEGSFVYETDDLRRRVRGTTTVRIRFTEDGETFVETDAHIVLVGDRYRWFTDCGTPVARAA
jgi:hypothetical protein